MNELGSTRQTSLARRVERAALDVEIAKDLRDRFFAPGASCLSCGTEDTWLLVLGRARPICYECDAQHRGLTGIERHHIGGSGGIAVWLPANRHRLHDLYQDVIERLGLDAGTRVVVELLLFTVLELRLAKEARRD
jgi:hypothetical protein